MQRRIDVELGIVDIFFVVVVRVDELVFTRTVVVVGLLVILVVV